MNEVQAAIKELRATMEIPRPTPLPKNVKRLAKDAAEHLGYETLLGIVGSGILQEVLEMLEIETLDKAAVYTYQKKFGKPMMNMGLSKRVGSLTKTGFLVDSDHENLDIRHDKEDDTFSGRPSWRATDIWVRTGLKSYEQEIPEFVLNKAVQIKKELPDVNLYVEHLVHKPDPFLVAVLDGEEFYVEVWEEPGFEGRISR